MEYVTDRKRVIGLGSSGKGTQHHWQMMVSSILLVFLIPAFVIVFATALGGSHDDVVSYFGRPGPAIISILTLVVVVWHLMQEVVGAVEDYIHGVAGKLTLVAVTALSYGLIIVGVFSIARIAL